MNQNTKLKAYQKVFLAFEFINGQLYMFKDFLKQDKKLALNNALTSTNKFLKVVSVDLKSDTLEENLNSDIDLITQMFDAFIQAEEKGIQYKFKNDFYRICQENNIKL